MKVSETRNAGWALLALTVSAFAIGTTEFMTNGLLLTLADEFDVEVAVAGLLATGYAAGIVVGGPVLAAATLRIRRKRLLLLLLAVFLAGNLVCAFAPSFTVLMIGRFVSAFSHGAYFGVASVVAASLVPTRSRAAAIAFVFTGVTLANVLGMPLGTFVGQHAGWRAAFGLVILLGLLGLVGIAVLIPSGTHQPPTTLRNELAALRSRKLWVALATTAIGFGGLFSSFTYIAPLLTEVTGFPASALTWLLMVYGVGLVVGNWSAGRFTERYPSGIITFFLAVLILALVAQALFAHDPAVTVVVLFVVGCAGFGLIPPLQNRVLSIAAEGATLVSTANIAAFNTGATLGSLLGAASLEVTGGYVAPSYAGAAMSLVGLVVFTMSLRVRGRRSPSPDCSHLVQR
ncbi:MFS transporter [Nonomuraea longicatena]|uniref:MFS transporter n=1 Tax=Nonomuraea longicatena TaxID=83682 RepID=A0ABP4BE11_9ACTN